MNILHAKYEHNLRNVHFLIFLFSFPNPVASYFSHPQPSMPSDFQKLTVDNAGATSRKLRRTDADRRSLVSIAISVAIPVTLTTAIILQFGSGRHYRKLLEASFWLPPLWLLHGCSIAAAALMGLASWLVWSNGGFNAESAALPLYIAQVSLAIVWDPLVLVIGSAPVGFVFCAVNSATLVACRWSFLKVNGLAAKIVEVCAFWAAVLTVVTLKLCFLPL